MGVAHRAAGSTDPIVVGGLAEARRAVDAGDWPAAEEALIRVDDRLAAGVREMALQPTSKGPVAHVPIGDPGVPPPRDEEPLSNRLLLVGRLAAVERARGRDMTDVLRILEAADAAYREGDRRRARALLDEAHERLDHAREPTGPDDRRPVRPP